MSIIYQALVDWDGPLPAEGSTDDVVFPSTTLPLSPANFQELCGTIDPLAKSTNFGIDLYQQCICFVQSKLSAQHVQS